MSRRCLCSRLLATLRDDPRLATLPLAVRMLFLLLAEAAARAPEAGVIPFSSVSRVSLLVSASETEVETGLETLATEALIRVEGGRIAVPVVQAGADRAAVARQNGARGGRPLKGETKEAYRERKQGSLLLPVPGGAAEKPSETHAPKPAAPLVESREQGREDSLSSSCSGGAREPEWVSLGMQVAELAGLDGARGGYDFRPVQAWLNAGHAPETILAAVRRRVEGAGYVARDVYSLKFFDRMVEREAARPRQRAGLVPVAVPERLTADDAARLAALEAMADRVQRGARVAAA